MVSKRSKIFLLIYINKQPNGYNDNISKRFIKIIRYDIYNKDTSLNNSKTKIKNLKTSNNKIYKKYLKPKFSQSSNDNTNKLSNNTIIIHSSKGQKFPENNLYKNTIINNYRNSCITKSLSPKINDKNQTIIISGFRHNNSILKKLFNNNSYSKNVEKYSNKLKIHRQSNSSSNGKNSNFSTIIKSNTRFITKKFLRSNINNNIINISNNCINIDQNFLSDKKSEKNKDFLSDVISDKAITEHLSSKFIKAQDNWRKNYFATFIQKIYRGYFYRKYNFISNKKFFKKRIEKRKQIYVRKHVCYNCSSSYSGKTLAAHRKCPTEVDLSFFKGIKKNNIILYKNISKEKDKNSVVKEIPKIKEVIITKNIMGNRNIYFA